MSQVNEAATIPSIPVLIPTMSEFIDLLSYIHNNEKLIASYGACKIIPPREWTKMKTLPLSSINSTFSISRQSIIPLSSLVSRVTNSQRKTINENEAMQMKIFVDFAHRPQNRAPQGVVDVESEFWKMIKSNSIAKRVIRYATEIEHSLFPPTETIFNLNDIPSKSLLSLTNQQIKGITTPFLHVGMFASMFSIHTEESDLFSMNYMHEGSSKFWYIIPSSNADQLEQCLHDSDILQTSHCQAPLRHKTLFPNPNELIQSYNIPVYRIEQCPNDIIVTFPRAYHWGFNSGFNIAESVNFALPSWIPFGQQAHFCTCQKNDSSIKIDMSHFDMQTSLVDMLMLDSEHISPCHTVDSLSSEELDAFFAECSLSLPSTPSCSVNDENMLHSFLSTFSPSTEDSLTDQAIGNDDIAAQTAYIRRKWIEDKDTRMVRLIADVNKPYIGSIHQWEKLINSDNIDMSTFLPENIHCCLHKKITKIESYVDWTTAFSSFRKAILYLFKHRGPELDAHFDRITHLYRQKPSLLEHILVYEATIRQHLQFSMISTENNPSDDELDVIHTIDIGNGSFPDLISQRIHCSDTIEFRNDDKDEYDVFQVYKDGNEYYRINNGIELLNINRKTSKNQRRIQLSFNLHCSTKKFYFCIILSSQREILSKSRQYPNECCENNCLILHQNPLKLTLTDIKASQKVILHQGDTIEFEWTSRSNTHYRIEENKYCPISGGLYTIESSLSKGNFRKTFYEYGTSFFFRLTQTNQIHDIITCLIKEKYQIECIEITDMNIQPNRVIIEQNDSIIFEWNTKEKQTIVQIDPFFIDENKQSIELKTNGEHFFWPYDPSYRGYMIHKFTQTGIFCFKTATNHIGTIIVEPKRTIHSFPVFGDQLILKMNTNDLVEFQWKITDSQEEPVLITVDANSSVVPDVAGGLTGIFDCSMHKCVRVEPFFRSYFHNCEGFLLHIPQHGLYSFAYNDNRNDVVLNVIVESSTHNHHVSYNEENIFEPNTLIINQNDQVWFESMSKIFANIYRTDEYGNHLELYKPIFQPQTNSINCFMQQFHRTGIYYFSTISDKLDGNISMNSTPLAIIVVPEIRFHYKFIHYSNFDSQAIITNINDFIIWQFEQIIRFGLIQLRSNETLEDLRSCHDRAVSGRNRQCLAVECIMPGVFYFANPEFERVTCSEEDRLISTIVIDPPFSQACFLVTHRQFVPNVLHIAQNETISWILLDHNQYHRISVESNENQRQFDEINRLDRPIEQYVHDIHYLYTFHQCGQFTIRSDHFNTTATVIVYSNSIIQSEKKCLKSPEIIEEIETLSPFQTQVHFRCSTSDMKIFYTLDGTLPTRHYDNVHIYNPDHGVYFDQSGFHLLRAYAIENEKLSSTVITSSPTFVMENEDLEAMNELVSVWNTTKIILSASIQYPNKLYGKIEVEPTSSIDLIEHFELYVDDVAQSVNLSPKDTRFSAEGFAGGEQYEIHILAYPKRTITDVSPKPSNKRAFEIKREIHGAPLISLAVSNEHSTIFLMWAHIGDHVSEYIVYVDDIERTTIYEKDFNEFFGIQFHGAQQRQRYLLHVEAKIKNTDEIRKSNIISVNPPLEMPLKEQLVDRYFAYITINSETPPPDIHLEIIHLDHFSHRRPEPQRKFESLHITNDVRSAIPKISFQQTSNGIRLFWKKTSQKLSSIVQSYRIIVDGEQYGDLISPDDESNFQLNLSPGKHECYLSIIPRDQDQEICESNILEFDIPYTTDYESNVAPGNDSSAYRLDSSTGDFSPVSMFSVTRIGIQTVNLSWKIDNSIDRSLINGYEILLNKKSIQTLTSNQQEYELQNLQSGTENDVQILVLYRSSSIKNNMSKSIRIICPSQPQTPIIETNQTNEPLSLGIKWKITKTPHDKITSFKIFLNDQLHGEIDANEHQSFEYIFTKLQENQTYSIYVKACIRQKKVDNSIYQCDMESNPSNELVLKCLPASKRSSVRIERMHPNGIDLVWDTPIEDDNTKIIGYQILKNGRPIGKPIPVDQRRASIHDLEVGNRYSLQVIPVTNQSRPNNEDNSDDYISGCKLDIEFTDLIQIPSKLWIENISGHSALVCWSPIDDTSNINTTPDNYKLYLWNPVEQTRDQATIISISKDKFNHKLNELQSATTYEIQLEAYKERQEYSTHETYIVSTISESLIFKTGAPPKAPADLRITSCTNTAIRLGFDPFMEQNAEIIALRVHCESISTRKHSKDIIFDLTPDTTDFLLSNLNERTEYHVTIYAITDEYLNEMNFSDLSQLPKSLEPSTWLISQSLTFTTSGCEPASQLCIRSATIESIELEWMLPKAYGSTELISQILRWKLEQGGDEHSLELDCNTMNAVIPGILQLGLYRISLDSIFRTKVNLDDETNEKEIRLTISETTSVCYHISGLCERPEICLTGYTTTTIDLTWNKPNMFNSMNHPERLHEKVPIHRKLLGYRVEINGEKYNSLDDDQYQCTLTECQSGEEYKVRLVARTTIQNEYLNETFVQSDEVDETPSEKLRIQMLTDEDLLRSFQANFEFHHHVTKENTVEQRNEVKPLGKINVHWTILDDIKTISHIILQWQSSKDLRIQQKTFKPTETSFTIDVSDEKEFYIIEIILMTNDNIKHYYKQLKMPIPGEPDAPKLWLVKTSETSFAVEWSEPKSYGIPVMGFQLYIEGKKAGNMAEVHLRRAEISSNINRTYDVNICALTNNPQRTRSIMSQTLSVITTPTVRFIGNSHDENRFIPVQIETINEEKLSIDWQSFIPMRDIRSYYIHSTCLNNNEIQTMQVSKQKHHVTLRDLKPGFSYTIMVLAAGRDGEILYTSEKKTIQMSVPPNAPIVAIRERMHDHVTVEWRPSPTSGELSIIGYKIYLNNRLLAILSHDQLTYTLTTGSACEEYTVHVQALSHDKNIASPLSRGVKFTWPGIKPGIFRRIDNGQTGTVIVDWEHPHLEDETDKLIGFRLLSENVLTHAIHLHGEYDTNTYQAVVYDLINGKYHLWLEIQSEQYCVRTRPITIISGRFRNRQSFAPAKCFMKKQKRFRSSTAPTTTGSSFRQIHYS
ncbi:hypothetical protein I4U23_000423 [Adineta vaga]|nr:hypothetical protein I4U23_000423 [Adineta vaga]